MDPTGTSYLTLAPNSIQQDFESKTLSPIFERHWKSSESNFSMMTWNIKTWREKTIERIDTYAAEQIRIIEEQKQILLNTMTANFNDYANNLREIVYAGASDFYDELIKACRQLEFKMAEIKNISESILFPKVYTVEEQKRMDEVSHPKPSPRVSILIQNRHKRNDAENPPQLEKNAIKKVDYEQRHSNNRTYDYCPFCFMIYPLTMNAVSCKLHQQSHQNYSRTVK